MYYNNKKLAVAIIETIIGLVLIVLGIKGTIDSGIWSAMGTALTAIGIASILRCIKYRTDEKYRNRIDTAVSDERMSHLRLKAWSISGYVFILAVGITVIIMLIKGMREQATLLSYCICFLLVVYVIAYWILQKKE